MFEQELPYNLEAECSVLGSILIEPVLIHECKLQPNEMYDPRHQLILQYMYFLRDLPGREKPVDMILIAEHAGKNIEKIGSIAYLTELASSVPSISNFEWYQTIVNEKASLRKTMQTMSKQVQQGNKSDNPAEFLSDSIQALEELRSELDGEKELTKLGDALNDYETVIQQRKEKKGLTGTKTASVDLDAITGGHQKQDLIIVAARPSIGKTAYILNEVIQGQSHALKENIPGSAAAIFSIEMPKAKLAERAVCAIANLDGNKVKTGEMDEKDWERWNKGNEILNSLPVFIDDSVDITLQQIERKVKKLVKDYPNLTVYIDYLQLVDPGKKFSKDDQGVKFVSRGLKRIARKYDIPVIAISAVGRKCEERQDKRPMMSDLRESGSIESDADVVIFLFRDDYYNRESQKKNIIELIVAKARDGATGLVEMLYIRSTSKFINIKRDVADANKK